MTPKSVAAGRVDAMCSAITSGVLDDVVLVRRRKGLQDERRHRFVSQIVVQPRARLPRQGGRAFLRDHAIHWFDDFCRKTRRFGVRVPRCAPVNAGREGERDKNGTKTGDTARGPGAGETQGAATGGGGTHGTHPPTRAARREQRARNSDGGPTARGYDRRPRSPTWRRGAPPMAPRSLRVAPAGRTAGAAGGTGEREATLGGARRAPGGFRPDWALAILGQVVRALRELLR